MMLDSHVRNDKEENDGRRQCFRYVPDGDYTLSMNPFLTKNRGLLLAYDQGLEHGPTDFGDRNFDPSFVMDLAIRGQFNATKFKL